MKPAETPSSGLKDNTGEPLRKGLKDEEEERRRKERRPMDEFPDLPASHMQDAPERG